MPKIPTFSAQGRPTAEVGSIKSNVQMPLSTALTSIQSAVANYYVKEKQEEANIKSVELQTKYYNTQEDGSAGLSTIINESGKIPEPTEANNYYLQEVKKLQQGFENKYLSNENNFVKKAWLSKFNNSTAQGNLVVNQSARIAMDKKKVVEKDNAMGILYSNLVLNPNVYSPTFERDAEDVLSKTIDNENELAIELEVALSSRDNILMQQQVTNNPEQFLKDITNPKKYLYANAEKKIEMIGEATELIKDTKFNILLKPLDIPFDANPRDFTLANEEIKNKNFGGNKELQKIFQTLEPQEKIEFEKEYQKKAKAIRSDRNMAILTQREVAKVETAIESKKIFDNMEKSKATYNKDLERIFGVNTAAVEQFTIVNEKVADGSANKLSNFEKNDDIVKFIINDKINTITDKFLLTGETGEGKSILERVGQDVNIADVKYLNNLLGISNEPNFKQNHTEFFKFIDNFKDQVAGSVALQPLDPFKDARLNKFKYVMYNRYIDGLERNINSDELLKATKGNKNFIGYDFYTFLPDVNDVFKGISNELKKNINNLIEQDDTPENPFISLKREKEKELGRKLTIQEFRELIKEK
tara:strand:- start:35 stop:1795 length:1761 start_codon:yes stop_codon:yes gene_type:complete